jgi:CheY-like chemotaxis protein
MPNINGYDVLRQCRADGFTNPFIFFTGHANSGDVDLSKLDVLAFIPKTEVDLLEETIMKAFS